ncbi:ATP-binding protein [Nitratidesulfovibrio sp.]|uniref:ATP-binding protein n=1 Tax=Nitratidesulfovibrio sp. TaxID=2802297 RepID=UPI00333EB6C5
MPPALPPTDQTHRMPQNTRDNATPAPPPRPAEPRQAQPRPASHHRPVRVLFAWFLLAFIAFQSAWAYWLTRVQARDTMASLRAETLADEATVYAALVDRYLNNRRQMLDSYAAFPPLRRALEPAAQREGQEQRERQAGHPPPQLSETMDLFATVGRGACTALYGADGKPVLVNGAPCDKDGISPPWLEQALAAPQAVLLQSEVRDGTGATVETGGANQKAAYWRLARAVLRDGVPVGVLSALLPVDITFLPHDPTDHRLRKVLLRDGQPAAVMGPDMQVALRTEHALSVPGMRIALETDDSGIQARSTGLLLRILPLLLAGTSGLVVVFHLLGHRLFVAPQEALQSLRHELEDRNRRLERVIQEQQQVDTLLETKSRLLEESEALLSAIISDQTELICRYLPDGTITFANDAFCAFFGVEREGLVGSVFRARTAPGAERDIFNDSLDPSLPAIATFDHWVVAGSGEERRLQWTRRTLYDDRGQLAGFQGVGRDVTTEYALEKALRAANEELEARIRDRTRDLAEREELLSRIFSGLRAAIVIVRPGDCAVAEVNTVARDLLGCGDAEEQCADLYRQITKGTCLLPGETGFATMLDQEHVLRRPDGRNIPVRWSLLPVPWQGAPHLALVFFDATAQKAMERRLTQAQKLESIGQLAAGVAHEINTPIQYVGDNLRFLGGAFEDLLRPLAECGALAGVPVKSGDAPKGQEKEEGEDTTGKGARQDTETGGGAAAGPSPPSADAGERLTRLRDTLAASDADFLADEVPRAITQALEGVERVASIVLAMKKFSHPETTEKRPADINQLVQDTVTVSRNEWKYVAEVETRLAPDLPLIPCLPGDLAQVLLNVVVNAAHAIAEARQATEVMHGDEAGATGMTDGTPPPPGRITITTRMLPGSGATSESLGAPAGTSVGTSTGASAGRGHVEIRIADTGTGIPEALRDRVFDPFFTTKEVGKGTGQGLAIAHDIVVKRHGGTIDFTSTTGRGTTFTITLPV